MAASSLQVQRRGHKASARDSPPRQPATEAREDSPCLRFRARKLMNLAKSQERLPLQQDCHTSSVYSFTYDLGQRRLLLLPILPSLARGAVQEASTCSRTQKMAQPAVAIRCSKGTPPPPCTKSTTHMPGADASHALTLLTWARAPPSSIPFKGRLAGRPQCRAGALQGGTTALPAGPCLDKAQHLHAGAGKAWRRQGL